MRLARPSESELGDEGATQPQSQAVSPVATRELGAAVIETTDSNQVDADDPRTTEDEETPLFQALPQQNPGSQRAQN